MEEVDAVPVLRPSDRHCEGEQLQKLFHLELLRLLLCEGEEHYTDEWVASWDAIERVAARPGSADPSSPVLTAVRTAAMARVTDMRHGATAKRAFGANVQVRRQFVVQKLSRGKVGRVALPGSEPSSEAAQPACQSGSALAETAAEVLPGSSIRAEAAQPSDQVPAAALLPVRTKRGEESVGSGAADPASCPEPAPIKRRRSSRPSVAPVRDRPSESELIWYSTTRMMLAHRKRPGDEWFPACMQRHCGGRVRAARPDEILWSGGIEIALGARSGARSSALRAGQRQRECRTSQRAEHQHAVCPV